MSHISTKTDVNITIRFFAKAREIVGYSSENIHLPTVVESRQALLDIIVSKYNLQEIRNNLILSINEEYCDTTKNCDNTIELKNGDEIAVIPPLSGG